MRLLLAGNHYVLESTFDEKDVPKQAGFRWSPSAQQWWTDDHSKALRLADAVPAAVGPDVRQALDRIEAKQAASVIASAATAADISIPAPEGLEYMPFQKAGIAYALDRPATLLADEMGLGKTIQAIGAMNASKPRRVLVICPASLKINWARELNRWLVHDLKVNVVPKDPTEIDTGVLVINYELLGKHMPALEARWDFVIVDEAHYIKNPKAQRTANVLRLAALGDRRIFLTGTPILNKPVELFPIANALAPDTFPKFFDYALRFCNAHKNRWGWDFSGASNLGELQQKLRQSVMVRRLKSDVLTELPAKIRQIIPLPVNGFSRLLATEAKVENETARQIAQLELTQDLAFVTDDDAAYEAAVAKLKVLRRTQFDQMSKVRHQTALAKVDAVADHIRGMLESTGKVVVFAHHRDVNRALVEALVEYNPVSLIGGDPAHAKQAAVDAFQTDPQVRVFVGSTQAAGVGLTLTASSTVVFAELDWVPGNVTQAEDRCHRIGQHDSVLVQHLVIDGSIDARMAHRIVAKQEVIDAALDDDIDLPEKTITLPEPEMPVIKRRLEPLPEDQIPAVHQALRILAGSDADYATIRNDAGFNKLDAPFGHDLASMAGLTPRQASAGKRLVKKYWRQLPDEINQQLAK